MSAYAFYCRSYQKIMKLATNFLDWNGPELLRGPGSVQELPRLIKAHGLQKVLVVTDPGLMKIGLPKTLLDGLEQAEIAYALYDKTQPNPTIENIEQARTLYSEQNCQGLIAFGGGSPMDCAKGVGARLVRPNKSIPQLRGLLKVRKKLPPFYAIPTTAGTGSETTLAAVVSNPETHEKYPINDTKLRPRYAVLDPELTVGLPKHITSTTGMDALTHAVESYIGRSNTKDTEKKALDATRLIFANLETAYNDGANIEARENMLLASFYAGAAFTRAYVGYVHGIAHNLGGMYNTPHGLANAVILPYVLDYYGEAAHTRLARLAEAAGITKQGQSDAEKALAFIAEIRAMNARMGIPDSFDFIKEGDIPTIAARALKEANPLYPVPKLMRLADCVGVIRKLYPVVQQ
ncbi:MAG: iron-containing alcohol dehydrogenase [Oscillospiraceae bacterium]|jgi:alcohol dehydrogenase class IV|nr:iron-containing alcohol dehydrogenase [Oscillospiraceae bacterium]